jgi:5'-nucleotidase
MSCASDSSSAELAVLGELLRVLWDNRADWAGDGHWLSVNLPAHLPAPLARARVGRDKIGATCDIVDAGPERITWRIRRGRPGTPEPGDENAVLRAGHIALVRHGWRAEGDLPAELTRRLNAALAGAH